MDDMRFVQRQPTRTRIAVGHSVADARHAVKSGLDACTHVAAWNDDGLDLYAESDAGNYDDGYRPNVDVYAHDDGRTHVLVDSSSLTFVGSLDGGLGRRDVNARADSFHDTVVESTVTVLADGSAGRISPAAWAPPLDDDPLTAIRDEFDDDELVAPDASDEDETSDAPTATDDDVTRRRQRSQDADADGTATDVDGLDDQFAKAVADRQDIETDTPNRASRATSIVLLVAGTVLTAGVLSLPPADRPTVMIGIVPIWALITLEFAWRWLG
jgi:hypothetical protein